MGTEVLHFWVVCKRCGRLIDQCYELWGPLHNCKLRVRVNNGQLDCLLHCNHPLGHDRLVAGRVSLGDVQDPLEEYCGAGGGTGRQFTLHTLAQLSRLSETTTVMKHKVSIEEQCCFIYL